MTEQEWLECNDREAMLASLHGSASDRKLRLFACACYRRVWSDAEERIQQAVRMMEQFADGLVGDDARRAANRETAHVITSEFPDFAAEMSADDARSIGHHGYYYGETRAQSDLLRDLFGTLPFRPVAISTNWLTPTVLSLAQAIYDERAFNRMPILADALEEVGCDNTDILTHCRSGGEHVRGCWALDLVLGRG